MQEQPAFFRLLQNKCDIYLIAQAFAIKYRDGWYRQQQAYCDIHRYKNTVLDLQHHFVEALRFEEDNEGNEGQCHKIYREEGHGNGAEESIVVQLILHIDDVHAPYGIDIVPQLRIPVSEDGDEDTHEDNAEDVGRGADVDAAKVFLIFEVVNVPVDRANEVLGQLIKGHMLSPNVFL